jgi:hypothetical protein
VFRSAHPFDPFDQDYQEPAAMYFRNRFNTFEEFQRESFDYGDRELGKDELELIEELEAADEFHARPKRNRWD